MSAPYSSLTASDYLDAAQALLPSGAAWPRDTNTTFGKYMNAIANVAWLAHQLLTDLFGTELDPSATVNMLPDWEAAFGLTARGSKTLRRIVLTSRIADPGGFNVSRYVALADTVGVTLDPTSDVKPTPHTHYTWEVHTYKSTPTATRTALESLIRLNNRATCVLNFYYDKNDPT